MSRSAAKVLPLDPDQSAARDNFVKSLNGLPRHLTEIHVVRLRGGDPDPAGGGAGLRYRFPEYTAHVQRLCSGQTAAKASGVVAGTAVASRLGAAAGAMVGGAAERTRDRA